MLVSALILKLYSLHRNGQQSCVGTRLVVEVRKGNPPRFAASPLHVHQSSLELLTFLAQNRMPALVLGISVQKKKACQCRSTAPAPGR